MKLTYFNVRARAEISRLILAQAGAEYEDKRIESDEWAELKPNAKWGSVPLLEEDDLCLGQSVTIARYLANKHGLAGKNNLEQYSCDAIIDTSGDWLEAYVPYHFTEDAEEKAKKLEAFQKSAMVCVNAFVTQLQSNGGNHMVGDSLTWADLVVFNLMWGYKDKEECAVMKEQMAPLMAVYDMVAALPNIKKWVETRPETSI